MTRLLACAVALAAAAIAPAATADELCAGVDNTGTVGPPVMVGPTCAGYPASSVCRTSDLGVEPTYVLHVYTCVPR